MSVSDKVKGLLALCGKKQVDMAASFGMSKQTMGNKMNRGSQQIIIDVEEKEKAPGE